MPTKITFSLQPKTGQNDTEGFCCPKNEFVVQTLPIRHDFEIP